MSIIKRVFHFSPMGWALNKITHEVVEIDCKGCGGLTTKGGVYQKCTKCNSIPKERVTGKRCDFP